MTEAVSSLPKEAGAVLGLAEWNARWFAACELGVWELNDSQWTKLEPTGVLEILRHAEAMYEGDVD